jgi:hypothetical protein
MIGLSKRRASLILKCGICEEYLHSEGGMVITPPDAEGMRDMYYFCEKCFAGADLR